MYSPIYINATTFVSFNISNVSLAFDIMIVLLAELAIETNLVGVVPPVGRGIGYYHS